MVVTGSVVILVLSMVYPIVRAWRAGFRPRGKSTTDVRAQPARLLLAVPPLAGAVMLVLVLVWAIGEAW